MILQTDAPLALKTAKRKPQSTPKPPSKSLEQQKSDFTAEGSPPPNMVMSTTPAGPVARKRWPVDKKGLARKG